jgi:hypothetical protein
MVGVGAMSVALLYAKWQRQSGLSVHGLRKGRTRTIAILLGVALVALMLGGLALRMRLGLGWGPIACGALTVPIAAFASAAWDRAWRAELAGDPE